MTDLRLKSDLCLQRQCPQALCFNSLLMPLPSICSPLLTFYIILCLNVPSHNFIFLWWEGWNASLPINPSVCPSLPLSLLTSLSPFLTPLFTHKHILFLLTKICFLLRVWENFIQTKCYASLKHIFLCYLKRNQKLKGRRKEKEPQTFRLQK